MCPAAGDLPSTPAIPHEPADRTAPVERARGVLMAVHRVDAAHAGGLLARVAEDHDVTVAALAVATLEAVQGSQPSDPGASAIAVRHLLGPAAFRPVLDGQLHPSMRAFADPPPGPPDISHSTSAGEVLARADERDRAAERRDRTADARAAAARARHALDPAAHEEDEADLDQAVLDRFWSGVDRDSAAGDRETLSRRREEPPPVG